MLLLLLLLLLALASLLSFPALQLSSDNWWRLLNTQTGDGCHSEREKLTKLDQLERAAFLFHSFPTTADGEHSLIKSVLFRLIIF